METFYGILVCVLLIMSHPLNAAVDNDSDQEIKAILMVIDTLLIQGSVIDAEESVSSSSEELVGDPTEGGFEFSDLIQGGDDAIFPDELANPDEGLFGFDEGGGDSIGDDDDFHNLAVRANVQASANVVAIGDPLTCTDQLVSINGFGVETIPIRQVLLNLETSELINVESSDVHIDVISGYSTIRNIDTSELIPGNRYSCVVQVFANSELVNLGNDDFIVSAATNNIDIDLTAQAGTKGRVLVLMDETLVGANTEPALSEQRALLQALLTQAGWFHTIVTSAQDFEAQLQTGRYINYLLLSEGEKLSVQGQTQLIEAVAQGAGLIEAGSQNQRQGRIDEALGVRFRGQSNSALGLALFDSDVATSDNVALLTPKNIVIAELDGAIKVAEFSPSQARGNQAEPPAITTNQFDDGRSVYFGFDLLSEATLLDSTQSIFAELIVNALSFVNNASLLEQEGVSRTVRFTVSNNQQATPARLTVTLPDGVDLISAPEAGSVEGNQIVWLLSLGEQQSTITEILFTQSTSDVVIEALVESGEEPDFVQQANASIMLTVESIPDVVVENLGIASSFNAFIFDDFMSRASNSQGRIAVGGNASLDSYGLASRLPSQPEMPTLIVGGDLSYGQGKIFVGSGLVGGTINDVNQTVIDGLEGGAFIQQSATIPIDFQAEFARLTQLSNTLKQVSVSGEAEYRYGGIYITGDCSSSIQVFNLDGATTLNSNHLVLDCVPDDATIIFNIDGQTAGFKNIGFGQLHKRAHNILYNYYEAEVVQFTNVSIEGSVLAPNAHFDNPRGQINGTVIGKSWNGPMALHDVPFTGALD